jgi:hypothetical protein
MSRDQRLSLIEVNSGETGKAVRRILIEWVQQFSMPSSLGVLLAPSGNTLRPRWLKSGVKLSTPVEMGTGRVVSLSQPRKSRK